MWLGRLLRRPERPVHGVVCVSYVHRIVLIVAVGIRLSFVGVSRLDQDARVNVVSSTQKNCSAAKRAGA